MNSSTHDMIALKDLSLNCLVGIHPHERIKPQPLQIQLKLFFERKPGYFGVSLSESVDYSHVCGDVEFLLEAGQFQLLETAAEAVAAIALMKPPVDRPSIQPDAVEVCIEKPQALSGKAIPQVTVLRHANEMKYGLEQNDFGHVHILHENQDCGVYLLHIPSGGRIPAHVHREMGEAELVISTGLELQGQPIEAGLAHFWPLDFVHQYDNPSEAMRTVLCVNRPAFNQADEIAVEVPEEWPDSKPYRKRFFGMEQNTRA